MPTGDELLALQAANESNTTPVKSTNFIFFILNLFS